MKSRSYYYAILIAFLAVLCVALYSFMNQNYTHTSQNSSITKVSIANDFDFYSLSHTSGSTISPQDLRSCPKVYVNDRVVSDCSSPVLINSTTYLSPVSIITSIWPDASIHSNSSCISVSGPLYFYAYPDSSFFWVNGNPYESACILSDALNTSDPQEILLQARPLAESLGCTVDWNCITGSVILNQISTPASAPEYSNDDLQLLSQIIMAEAGSEPMEGKIAVGSVILNRVCNPLFPNSIHDVIYQRGQFSPAGRGLANRSVNEESLQAAKLCLEGAREAGNSLYFNTASPSSYANRNLRFICSIGHHNFFA